MKAARETPENVRSAEGATFSPKGRGKLSGGRIAAGRFSGHGAYSCPPSTKFLVISRQDREPTYSGNRGVCFDQPVRSFDQQSDFCAQKGRRPRNGKGRRCRCISSSKAMYTSRLPTSEPSTVWKLYTTTTALPVVALESSRPGTRGKDRQFFL